MSFMQLDNQNLYSEDDLKGLNPKKVPSHIAIIMDGNRRWAKKFCLPSILGHWKGTENLTRIVKAAKILGIKNLTVFAFSTENWSRSKQEIDDLIEIFKKFLKEKRQYLVDENVRLSTIGDLSIMPAEVNTSLNEVQNLTENCSEINLILAVNYGGRDDIRRAVIHLIQDSNKGKFSENEISEDLISTYLDTKGRSDPELLIRTSGETRISNFLLWQISYTEIYVTDVLWPDFDHKQLLKAIIDYQHRERRLGG